jgi:hypothetical protein
MYRGRLFSCMADPFLDSAARATRGHGGSSNAGTAEALLLIDWLQIGDRGPMLCPPDHTMLLKRLVPLKPFLEGVPNNIRLCTSRGIVSPPAFQLPRFVLSVRWYYNLCTPCRAPPFPAKRASSGPDPRPAAFFISRPTGQSLVVPLCTSLSGASLSIQRCPSMLR